MLDFRTGLLLWTIQAASMGALLIVVWLHGLKDRHFLLFGLGLISHASGLALVGARGMIPDFLSIQVANGVTLTAFAFFVAALRRFDGNTTPPWATLPPLLWITGNLFPFIRDDFSNRVMLYSVSAALGFALMSFVIARGGTSSRRYRYILSGVWAIHVASNLLFALRTWQQNPQGFQDVGANSFVSIVGIIGFVTAIMILAKLLIDRSEERLKELVRTDPLTGIYNRRGLLEVYERLRSIPVRERPVLAVIVFDLDHFKQINDTHGHQAGDAVIVEFARRAAGLIPAGGVFGRSGGEEFAAILRVGEPRHAALVAETIRQSVATSPVATDAAAIEVTTSIGIATMPAGSADLDRLLSGADRALYVAKDKGRNRCAVWTGERILSVHTDTADLIDDQTDRQVAALRILAKAASDEHDALGS
ncbi:MULTISPECIES: GGDEF domain-containing protein [Ciceribacter]|uniref:diguanylate cyclase n=1 Tax=Ciceribacter lividus TaxID=1197950 RepID=A0A6I7HQ47_9HYPH|nr:MULTISPECIES: GGDEF domain-containing protein [Ciceribacter]MCO6177871.1 GGDEF domain-containing protein [Ciceribacter sp. RN22]RCW27783.1 diguanylate cyclase (GGDEF)-like protein [Ciceribacter lividus]